MKSYIRLRDSCSSQLPEEFSGEDERSADGLVEVLLEEYTRPGDTVIDIFAGFGTTLIVAERMDRIGYGIEANSDRFNYAKSQMKHKENLVYGDARLVDQYEFPQIDFALCSPVYMNRKWYMDPLTNDTTPQTYGGYLVDLQRIFAKLGNIVEEGGYVAIEAANFVTTSRKSKFVTTFAWDLCRAVANVLRFERETVICWDEADPGRGLDAYGYNHSYCLLFRNLPVE